MELQGRELLIEMRGSDVELLHIGLEQLGFDIPEDERTQTYFGPGTRGSVERFQRVHLMEPTGVVDAETARAISAEVEAQRTLVVRGRVTNPDGSPFGGALVRAYDKDLRNQELLGEKPTDEDGRFEIPYTPEQFCRAEKGSADLLVRVSDREGREVASSQIVFNARPVETVDLLVTEGYQPPSESEYERLIRDITPVLQGVPLHELAESDIDFLAGDTGIERERIVRLVESARRAREIDLPQEALYVWLGEQDTRDSGLEWSRPTDEFVAAVERAVDRNEVPDRLRDQLPEIREAVTNQRLVQVLRPAPEGTPASLGDLLRTMPERLDESQQRAVAAAVEAGHTDAEGIAESLRATGLDPERAQVAATRVDRTLRLGDLTMRHAPLVRALLETIGDDGGPSLRPLASLGRDRWVDVAYAHGVPADQPLGEAGYAAHLARTIEDLHPTEVLKARLTNDDLRIYRPGFDEVAAYLQDNPEVDILNTSIESLFPPQNPDDTADGQPDDEERLKARRIKGALLKAQRIKKLDATWDETAVLLNAGLDSALDVVNHGRDRLRATLSDRATAARSDAIYEHAQAMHDTGLALMANYMPRFGGGAVPVMHNVTPAMEGSPSVDGSAAGADSDVNGGRSARLEDYPTLQSLFGPLDDCECGHCRSVLSPAAYLVDLLKFLEPSQGAFEALTQRRPDLFALELSCNNTETRMSHIDLVLEILENAVGLPITRSAYSGTEARLQEAALRKSPLPKWILDILKRTTLELGPDLVVERLPARDAAKTPWKVTDRTRQWTLLHHKDAIVQFDLGTGSSRELSMDRARLDEIKAGLDSSSVVESAKEQFDALLTTRNASGLPLPPSEYTVEPVEPGNRWKVRYRNGVRVTIDNSNGEGKLGLGPVEGEAQVERNYSSVSLEAISSGLKQGNISGPLSALLPSNEGLAVGLTNPQGGWYDFLTSEREFELAYLPDTLRITSLTYQSPEEREDTRTVPQNRNPEAYERLRKAIFPWALPFDLPLAEVRAFLGRLGVSRLRLMELCDPAGYQDKETVAHEVLGLSKAEAALISTPSQSSQLWERWGVVPGDDGEATVYDASSGVSLKGAPLELLKRPSILLQQARLDFRELLDVLQTRFVSSAGSANLVPWLLDECRPSEMHLDDLTEAHLDRIHRFVRLWRKVGWRPHELDLAIDAILGKTFGVVNIPNRAASQNLLARLSHLKRLHHRLGLPIDVISSWWGGLGTPVFRTPIRAHTKEGQPEITPLYDRLFLNPILQDPPDPDFRLNGDRNELVSAGENKKISEKQALVSGALGIRQEDLFWLLSDPMGVQDNLTLGNLVRLHRIAGLCRGLGLPIRDYFSVRRLTKLDPFASQKAAISYCEAVSFIRASGFTPEALMYLLGHQETPGSPDVLTDEKATSHLTSLRQALYAKRAETDITYEEEPEDSVELTEEQKEQLKEQRQGMKEQLADLAIATVASQFGFDYAVASLLLRKHLRHPLDSPKPAIDLLLEKAFADIDPEHPLTENSEKAGLHLVHRLHKTAMHCATLNVTTVQLSWIGSDQSPHNTMNVLDFNVLPVGQPPDDPSVLFEEWKRLVTLLKLRDRAPAASALLSNYVAALPEDEQVHIFDPASTRTVLADGLMLPPQAVKGAADRLAISDLDDHRDPIKLTRWLDLLAALKKLGATAEQAGELAEASPTVHAAATARNLLRAKYGIEASAELLKPISDALREQQRNALVDYLVTRDGLRGPDDLYERYLIDVQMSSCEITTRIFQAISAVQLFVQRCLLGLEKGVTLEAEVRDRWEAMKNYRLWEAQRRIFLSPQNWLLPELRDDKSQIFRELEGVLSGPEASDELAGQALVNYLDQLDELAQIKVLGMYEHQHDPKDLESRVLYVAGRSPNPPYRYFWRRCDSFGGEGMRWTAWERVDLEIAGEHLMPFVLEGDLHLAWPIIRRGENDEGKKQWEVQLAWAKLGSRGWTDRKVGRETVPAKIVYAKDERRSFTFRLQAERVRERLLVNGEELIVGEESLPRERVYVHCYAAAKDQKVIGQHPGTTKFSFGPGAPSLQIRCKTWVYYEDATEYAPIVNARVEFYVEPLPVFATSPYFVERARLINGSLHSFGSSNLFTTNTDGDSNSFILLPPYVHVDGKVELTKHLLHHMRFALKVTHPYADTEKNPQYLDYNGENPHCMWSPVFLFKVAEKPDKATEQDEELLLQLEPLCSFCFLGSNDLKLEYGRAPDLEPIAGEWATRFGNGYLEGRNNSNGELFLPAFPLANRALQVTSGRFMLVPLTNTLDRELGTWHFVDDGSSYFLQRTGFSEGQPGYSSWSEVLNILTDGHPYVPVFRQLADDNLRTLFSPQIQLISDGGAKFKGQRPWATPTKTSLLEQNVAFERRSPYASYNWEIFLHIPLLVARHLTQQRRFEEAQRWLHFVFDPKTEETGPAPERFWRTLPLRKAGRGQPIGQLLEWLANPSEDRPEEAEVRDQIATWRQEPFRPHAIARMRHGAYQWHTLFAYLDNLLDWGDDLFRRDTRLDIDKAKLHYEEAKRILGPRPRSNPSRVQPRALTYRELAGSSGNGIDDFSNAWHAFADHPLAKAWSQSTGLQGPIKQETAFGLWSGAGRTQMLSSLGTLYFCVPHNEQLRAYWDRLEDRLFNINHCRNIEGIERELPLVDPPIDPGLVIRAIAAGLDIESVLADRAAPRPRHRFNVLLQNAVRICSELKSLGASLLSAVEKQDAEAIALLRSGHERELLEDGKQIRQDQCAQAIADVDVLIESRKTAGGRYLYYQRLLGKTGSSVPAEGAVIVEEPINPRLAPSSSLDPTERGLGLIQSEQDQLARLAEAQLFSGFAAIAKNSSSVASMVKAVYPAAGIYADAVAAALDATADAFNALSTNQSHWASRAALIAGYERRRDEWTFQSNAGLRELAQIDKQLAAAKLRSAMADHELTNHDNQIERAEYIEDFMRNKYTNRELYSWMVDQISDVYFRTYQLAYDMAKRAEKAYRFELGLEDDGPDLVKSGYWDGLRDGLLAGEKLSYDLQRLEVAYLERDKRPHELIKHVSLRQLDSIQLLTLKATGSCTFEVPEWLYDLDTSGHYMRRIKSVSLSIPAVTGPYTSLNCTLTLNSSYVRKSKDLIGGNDGNDSDGGKYVRQDGNDDRFTDYLGQNQSIVTSSGNNDSGMFETNLRDERYLPFEGAGACSKWTLELPNEFRQFDYNTISDVILHIRYTALQGGGQLRDAAVKRIKELLAPLESNNSTDDSTNGGGTAESVPVLIQLFSLQHDFPSEWHRFVSGGDLKVKVKREYFPYFVQSRDLVIDGIELRAFGDDGLLAATPSGVDSDDLTTKLKNNKEFEISLVPDGEVLVRRHEALVFLSVRYALKKSP